MVRGSRNYWFHAKDPAVGFGWSSPASWQGWLVLATYVAVVLGGAGFLVPARFGTYLLLLLASSAVFIGIAFLTGEPQQKP